jgi:hypothetical protein
MNLHRLVLVVALILASLEDRIFPHTLLPDVLSERAHLASHTLDLLSRAFDNKDHASITKADLYSKLPVNLSPEGLQLSYQMLRKLAKEREEEHYAYVKEIEVTHDPIPYTRLWGDADMDDVLSTLYGVVNEGWHSFDNLESFK